jgi:hypothetical protein
MMDWLPKMMDWLPHLILAVAAIPLSVAVAALAASCLRLKITWKREGSVEFLGFKCPWKKESKDDPAV